MSHLSISQLFSLEQLQQLMRVFVRGDQPWIQHALVCLLQDMLDVTISNINQNIPVTSNTATCDDVYETTGNVNNDMDTDSQPPGPSWGPNNNLLGKLHDFKHIKK